MGESYKLCLWKPCRNKPGFYFPVLPYVGRDYFGNLRNALLLCIVNYTIQTHPGLWFHSPWRSQCPVEKELFLFMLGLWGILRDTSSTLIYAITWLRLKIRRLPDSKKIFLKIYILQLFTIWCPVVFWRSYITYKINYSDMYRAWSCNSENANFTPCKSEFGRIKGSVAMGFILAQQNV